MDTWVASTLWLLWIMLLWTWVYKYLFETLFSILLYIYPEVGLLDHIVVPFLIFWGTSRLFSIVAAPTYIPTNSAQGFPVSPHPHQLLAFLVVAILLDVRWYWFCIFKANWRPRFCWIAACEWWRVEIAGSGVGGLCRNTVSWHLLLSVSCAPSWGCPGPRGLSSIRVCVRRALGARAFFPRDTSVPWNSRASRLYFPFLSSSEGTTAPSHCSHCGMKTFKTQAGPLVSGVKAKQLVNTLLIPWRWALDLFFEAARPFI